MAIEGNVSQSQLIYSVQFKPIYNNPHIATGCTEQSCIMAQTCIKVFLLLMSRRVFTFRDEP